MLGRLGHRVDAAAVDFVSRGPSAGIRLLAATILAIVVSHAPIAPTFEAFLHTGLGVRIGRAAERSAADRGRQLHDVSVHGRSGAPWSG
nr:hypothetical protein [Acuticoccus mangrovi]